MSVSLSACAHSGQANQSPRTPAIFACQECGRKFRHEQSARRAAEEGCPNCNSVDIEVCEIATEGRPGEIETAEPLRPQADTFTLTNPPPRPRPAQFHNAPRTVQKTLLSGLDCLPGQLDVFNADGHAEELDE